MHYYGEILQIYHIFALFDTPKMGNLMIPVVAPKKRKTTERAQRGGAKSKSSEFTKSKASQLPEGFSNWLFLSNPIWMFPKIVGFPPNHPF